MPVPLDVNPSYRPEPAIAALRLWRRLAACLPLVRWIPEHPEAPGMRARAHVGAVGASRWSGRWLECCLRRPATWTRCLWRPAMGRNVGREADCGRCGRRLAHGCGRPQLCPIPQVCGVGRGVGGSPRPLRGQRWRAWPRSFGGLGNPRKRPPAQGWASACVAGAPGPAAGQSRKSALHSVPALDSWGRRAAAHSPRPAGRWPSGASSALCAGLYSRALLATPHWARVAGRAPSALARCGG